jgi:hypothetical protein
VSREYGITIPMQKMLREPTVEGIALEITNASWFNAGVKAAEGQPMDKIKI